MGKKIYKYISGLPFGILLLVLIAIYSVFGTLIPQGMPLEFYLTRYENLRTLIILLGFNNAYNSLIFKILMLLFMVNLLTCTYNFAPSKISQLNNNKFNFPKIDDENLWREGLSKDYIVDKIKKEGFKIRETTEGVIGVKYNWGILGSTITHLGLIIILLGAIIGSFFAQEGYFTMLPGEELFFPGKEFRLKLEDFKMDFREDGSVQQYYSDFTIFKNGQKVEEKTIWVNNPLKYAGIGFYQSNFGWSGQLLITDRDNNILVDKFLKTNEHHFFSPEHLSVYLFGVYPNFRVGHDGMPATFGHMLLNPRFAVLLYHFGQHVDSVIIKPGENITFHGYNITFDNPTLYTGITYRSDIGYPVVLLGFLVLTIGLIIAFYCYPRYVYIGEDALYGFASKNSWGFKYWLKKL